MEPIKIFLVDNEEVFREGLARLLKEQRQIEVVYQCDNGREAVEKSQEIKPHIILMDSQITDCAAVEAVQQISKNSPEMKIAMLTRSDSEEDLFNAMEAGARGYMAKNMPLSDLLSSIKQVAGGRIIISPHFSGKFLEEFASLRRERRAGSAESSAALSPREIQIVRLVAEGATNKEIARDLFIAENTVKVHLKKILGKLGLRNRQQLAAYAVERGLAARSNR